jgi:hypothetical protein
MTTPRIKLMVTPTRPIDRETIAARTERLKRSAKVIGPEDEDLLVSDVCQKDGNP